MRYLIYISLLIGLSFAQSSLDFSYEMKYGNGDSGQYGNNYFENLLDVNGSLNQDLYLYAQLEYSEPPLFGYSRQALHKLTLDYFQDNLNVSLGDLFVLYGYGLTINTNQDQAIGYDNTVRGVSLDYQLNDDIRMFGLLGQGKYQYALNASTGLPTREFANNVTAVGIAYGELSAWLVRQDSHFSESQLQNMWNADPLTALDYEYLNRVQFDDISADTVRNTQAALSYYLPLGFLDLGSELVWSSYDLLMGGTTLGNMSYYTIGTNLAGWGLTWEYKDYDMPFYVPSLSNPPIGFREASSTLIGRASHNMNFGDEIGQQFEVTGSIFDLSLLANWSFSRRHAGFKNVEEQTLEHQIVGLESELAWQELQEFEADLKAPSPGTVASFDLDDEDFAFYPYREIYGELSGYVFDGHLYWMLGYDRLDDVTKYHPLHELTFDSDNLNEVTLTEMIEENWTAIWELNYFPDLGLGEDYANSIFENTYGMPLSDAIAADVVTGQDLLTEGQVLVNNYEYSEVVTIPTNFAWNFGRGNSITIYLDQQWKTDFVNRDIINTVTGAIDSQFSTEIEGYYRYCSTTLRLHSMLSFSLLYDYEKLENKVGGVVNSKSNDSWTGYEIGWDINPQAQLSLFYGSLKGGRICANGICAEQPDFQDGLRVTFRTLF